MIYIIFEIKFLTFSRKKVYGIKVTFRGGKKKEREKEREAIQSEQNSLLKASK